MMYHFFPFWECSKIVVREFISTKQSKNKGVILRLFSVRRYFSRRNSSALCSILVNRDFDGTSSQYQLILVNNTSTVTIPTMKSTQDISSFYRSRTGRTLQEWHDAIRILPPQVKMLNEAKHPSGN